MMSYDAFDVRTDGGQMGSTRRQPNSHYAPTERASWVYPELRLSDNHSSPPPAIPRNSYLRARSRQHIRQTVRHSSPLPTYVRNNNAMGGGAHDGDNNKNRDASVYWATGYTLHDELKRREAATTAHYNNLAKAELRIDYQARMFPAKVQQYIRPIMTNQRAIRHMSATFLRLDTDSKYLSKSAANFIQGLHSVSDDHEGEDPGDNSEDSDNDDDDDGWQITCDESDNFDQEAEWDESMAAVTLPAAATTAAAATAAAGAETPDDGASGIFMMWQDFSYHPLSRDPDIVNDRRKSIIAIAMTVEMGIPSPAGSVTVKGLFGLLATVLRWQDWRAYYQASSRHLLLPPQTPMGARNRPLTEYCLEGTEKRVLCTSKYLAAAGRSMMTCLSYSDGDYGAITLFDMEMVSHSKTSWPTAIWPHAALPRVPKKLLRKIAEDMPRSKKTELCVNSAKDQISWPTGTFTGGAAKAVPTYNSDLEQTDLSKTLLEALPVQSSELTGPQAANCVAATIPAMLALLHARNAYLTNIKIEGIRLVQPEKRVAKLVYGPQTNDHQGANPTVVVIHPDEMDWATELVYWV